VSRLMSVSHTTQAVIERRKTVTRRLGWKFLKPGDTLTLCEKVMGRKKGEPLVRLAEVEVVDVRRELLGEITTADIEKEGVSADTICGGTYRTIDQVRYGLTEYDWLNWFCREMRCTAGTEITRIEWRYLDAVGAAEAQQ
jgi:hypothetical protein